MRQPADLTHQELSTIATRLQQALYLDGDAEDRVVWNPDKSWAAADILDDLATLLAGLKLVPENLTEAGGLLP